MAAPTGNLLNGGGGALGGRTEIRFLSDENRWADRDAAPCNDLHSSQLILALGRPLGSGTHQAHKCTEERINGELSTC